MISLFRMQQFHNAVRNLIVDNSTDKFLGDRCLRAIKHLHHAALFHHFAIFHHNHLIADHLDHLHLMDDKQNGDTHLLIDALEQIKDGFCRLGVQRTGGLIAQKNRRFRRQRTSDPYPLLLSSGEMTHISIQFLIQFHKPKDFFHSISNRLLIEPFQDQWNRHILKDGLVLQQIKLLEHHPDLAPYLP